MNNKNNNSNIIGAHICLEGCHHEANLTFEELEAKTVEQRFNPDTMSYDRAIVCPGCSADTPRRGDFCMNTVIHRVITSYPLVRGTNYDK